MPKNICRLKRIGIFLTLTTLLLSLVCCNGSTNESDYGDNIVLKLASTGAHTAIETSATAAIGIEVSSGEIFYAKNIEKRLPMASTTKIMTAIVAIENGNLSDTVRIHKDAVGIEGSSIYLYENEALTLEDLLYALMLESANDAAMAIAIHIAGDAQRFVELMNDKAISLGLINTHFENPHGLDSPEHYTTAYDLGVIAAYCMQNPTFRKIVSTYKKVIPLAEDKGARVLINHNKLIRNYDGAIGIKTGYTKKSGRCLISAASRDGVELICVTLSAPSDWQDHEAILDLGYSIYEHKMLALSREVSLTIPIVNASTQSVTVENFKEIEATVAKEADIKVVIEAPRFLFAPIKSGDIIGRVIYIQNNKVIATAPLCATQTVDQVKHKGFFDTFRK